MNIARNHSLRVSSQLELTPIAFDLFSSYFHTSKYQSWSREGAVLAYDKGNSGLKAEHNRKSAAYIAAGLIDDGDPWSGRVPRVYYFNCQPQSRTRRGPGKEVASPTENPTSPTDILNSLKLQALAEGDQIFRARFLSTTEGRTALQGTPISVDLETKKRHFISYLRTLSVPSIIAVDNVDDVEGDCGMHLIWELAHRCQDLGVPTKFVVSITNPHEVPFEGISVSCVWNDLEYLGWSIPSSQLR